MCEEIIIKVIWAAFVIPVALTGILLWFFNSYQKKKYEFETEKKEAKLREQAYKIEKQEAIELERNRIANEMHDDLGSGLTIIRYLSDDIINSKADPEIEKSVIKIAEYSTRLVQNMSEIIWAMNSRFDNVEGLISYLRRYVVEYLEDNKMEHTFLLDEDIGDQFISGENRRNVLLVVKEILHNSIKYSGARSIHINCSLKSLLMINILESGGKGFDPDMVSDIGNGIHNMKKRMDASGGSIIFENTGKGMHFQIRLPLKEIKQKDEQIS